MMCRVKSIAWVVALCVVVVIALKMTGDGPAAKSVSLGGLDAAVGPGKKVVVVAAPTGVREKFAKAGCRPVIGPVSVTVDGREHTPLKDYVTLRFKAPEGASVSEMRQLVGVYCGDDYVYRYLPNPVALEEGVIEFKMHHLCYISVDRPEDAELMDIFIRRTATVGFTREREQKDLVDKFKGTVSEGLSELGLGDDTIAGNALRYALGHVSGGEYVRAAMDGDYQKMPGGELALAIVKGDKDAIRENLCDKAAEYLLDRLTRNAGLRRLAATKGRDKALLAEIQKDEKILDFIRKYGGTAAKYADAVGHAVGGDLAKAGEVALDRSIDDLDDKADALKIYQQALNGAGLKEVSKEIAKKLVLKFVPHVDAVVGYGELIRSSANIWADDTANEMFEHFYRQNADAKGCVDDDTWNEIVQRMAGALRWLKTCGKDESDVRRQFEKRFVNAKEIDAREKELEGIIRQWRKDGLLEHGRLGFGEKESMTDRLERLYMVREQMIRLLSVGGGLYKGKLMLTDEEFLSHAMWGWYHYGPKGRAKFWDWLTRELAGSPSKFEGHSEQGGKIVNSRTNTQPAPKVTKVPAGKKTSTAKGYWQQVEKKFEKGKDKVQKDPQWGTVWDDRFSGSELYFRHDMKMDGGDKHERASFNATCSTEPPRKIASNETLKFALSLKTTASTYLFWEDTARVFSDDPGLGVVAVTRSCVAAEEENNPKVDGLKVSAARDEKKLPRESSGVFNLKMPVATRKGQRICIYFRGCGSQTCWIYEWCTGNQEIKNR